MKTLQELRAEIDQADRELLAVLGRRFALCNEVAALKGEQTQVLQPGRVQEVLLTRSSWANEFGVEPEFAELIFRSLLSETHRIEAVHLRADHATTNPSDYTPGVESALQTAACRIDHVSVAVTDLDAAVAFFVEELGFRVGQERRSHPDHPGLDSVVVEAGGVTFVLFESDPDERVATGVHHIAIEVLNAAFVRSGLADRGCPLQTEVLVGASGLERFFTVRDASLDLQLGFVSRIGDRTHFDSGDIKALSAAIEQAEAGR